MGNGARLARYIIARALSNALNVSVSEILNGEKSQNNESEIDNAKLLKKLKIKKYIRLAAEIVITIVYAYWLYIFKDTFKGFQNVLDLALHKNEIELLSVFTLIFIFLFVLWLIVEIITTIINKKRFCYQGGYNLPVRLLRYRSVA